MSNKIVHVFRGADLRCGHKGLSEIAKSKAEVKPGEHCAFINNSMTSVKLLSANGVLIYLKLPRGKLTTDSFNLILQAFKIRKKFNYVSTLRKVLQKNVPGALIKKQGTGRPNYLQ